MADRIKNYQQGADEISILKDIRMTLGVTPSSYTPDATEVTRDRVVTFAQAEEELSVLGDIQTGMQQFVADTKFQVGENTGDIANIKALLQGQLYNYQTDSTEAYVKTVPAGALPYAGVEKLGGKTLVWNQLVQNGNFADGTTGWAAVDNPYLSLTATDGVMSCVTTGSSNRSWRVQTNANITAGHKYFVRGNFKRTYSDGDVDANTCTIGFTGISSEIVGSVPTPTADVVYKLDSIVTATNDNTKMRVGFGTINPSANTPMFELSNINLYDLTLMFGAGNEPSTVQEFQQMFPADWYPYNAGTLLSAGVTEVVSKDSNDDALQTLSIPAEVQALEGYGWSAGTAYNYIDFERKVFVQNVDRIDMGTMVWQKTGSHMYSTSLASVIKPNAGKDVVADILCLPYITKTYNTLTSYTVDKCCSQGQSSGSQVNIQVYDSSYTTASDFTTAMNGVYFYYELATPIETDISAYLTDDNLVQVEPAGTLTFKNQNGDDYRIPVPSDVTYMIDLQAAINDEEEE